MAFSSVQVAGIEPVEPAAMKGRSVRVNSSRAASRRRMAERRACGPMAFSRRQALRIFLARDGQEFENGLAVARGFEAVELGQLRARSMSSVSIASRNSASDRARPLA